MGVFQGQAGMPGHPRLSTVAPETGDPPGLVAAVSETMQVNGEWLYGIH